MDIKSKSSKKFSFLMAGILVALAVCIFLTGYPIFKRRIDDYNTASVKSAWLLEWIYQGNLVLYKDISDKVEGKSHSYSELYLTIEEQELERIETSQADVIEGIDGQEVRESLEYALNSLLGEWRSDMLDNLVKKMDYLVVDHKTGEMIKNTGRDIEKLYDKTMTEEENPYDYYIMLSYDSAGNLSDTSVRDRDPDELLKNTQSVMSRNLLAEYLCEWGISYYSYLKSNLYLYDSWVGPIKMEIRLDEKPKDVTFVYAMTAQQKADLMASNIRTPWNGSNYPANYYLVRSYYEAGVGNFLMIIILALILAALLMTRSKRYCMHQLMGFHMHLEVSAFAIYCMMALHGTCVMLMASTNSGYFPDFYDKYLVFLPKTLYTGMTVLINLVVLSLYFGGWYYFITTFGELFSLGIKNFIKERSLIVRILMWILRGCKKQKDSLKEELLHADLSRETDGALKKMLVINYIILAIISFMWAFGWVVLVIYTIVLYIYIKKYIGKIKGQYEKLLEAVDSMAQGDLDTKMDEDFGVFESCREALNQIQDGFRKAVNEEVRSQRMKTELITNVSHDLKTPLTAITTYIELLEGEGITKEQRKEYLEVLKKKSERLKFLIEDLFEVSKANSGNVSLNLMDVDICNLLRQVYHECEDKVEEAELIFRFSMPEEKCVLKLDSQKTYRVFENLYTNIVKYAMPRTRVYVNVEKRKDLPQEGMHRKKGIRIELKNMSAAELNILPEDLTERFVRGDSSRNTEGSGLGLAIAKSFVEIQGGELKVEIDGDLFKVVIEW